MKVKLTQKTRNKPGVTGSCRYGDHDLCLQTALSDESTNQESVKSVCGCKCHRGMRVDHRPTTRDARVTSRHKSWNYHWYLAVYPTPVNEYKDESIIEPPKDWKEILYG